MSGVIATGEGGLASSVIPAALQGVRRRGDLEAHIAVTLIDRCDQSRWLALARPVRNPPNSRPRTSSAPSMRRVTSFFSSSMFALTASPPESEIHHSMIV